MKKAYSKSSRQGLPGGPNEMFQKVKGIIVSERGQWDFPGMNTLVPTQDGRITMRGVPYPVLGQDETGYTQMMYPEQEYQFPGQNVLELPMAQNGLSTPIINLPEYTVIDEKIPENIRLANTAKRLVEELYDVSRPAAGFTEKISDLFIPGEKKYYDNTCVKGVCDIFKEANLNSGIPEDVLNNKDFLENYSKYGFTLVPNEQLQVGDIIQYYEKDRPTHLGIYVGDDEYVGDGSKDKPLVKSNIHKYPDGKDKLPFRAFRKNFKSGGSLPKAQPGLQTENPNEVKYGTPEYEQAYNQGTLTTSLSGDPEDFVRARTLPEFKITPQYTSLRDDLSRAAVLGVKGAAELTGIPGTVRFAQNPVTSLKGAGNTLVDLGMTVGAFARMNPAGGIQYATQGVNPLTGEGSFRAEDVEGAFNTLDAVGTATVLGSALKAPVTAGMKQAVNTIPKGVVDYGKDLAYSIPRGKLPQYANAVRWQPDEIPGFLKAGNLNLTDEQKALKGSWYGYDPATFNSSLSNPNQKIDVLSGLGFYPQTRPGPGNVLVNRLSERQIRNLEKSMSPAAKGMSGKPKSVTVSDDYLQGELTLPPEIRNNPNMNIRFDVNPSEYLSPNYSNKDFSTLSLPEKTLFRKEIGEGVSNIINSNYQPIKFAGVSVPRKYFPFQDGGSLPKAQTLGQFNPQVFKPNPLTGRYNWEKPKAKPQLRDFEPKQKAAERSSTNVATKPDPIKAARQINAAAAEEYERNRQGVIRATNRPVSVFRPGAGDPEAIMEFTGLPSAVRIAQNPESVNDFLSGVDQLILGSSPVSGMMGMRRDFTPEETQALLDYSTVATMGLPLVRGAGKLGAQGLKQTGKYLTQGPLRNAYKINPWRFKADPEAYYHRSPNLNNIINQETRMLQGFGESEAGKLYSKLAQPGAGPQVIKNAGTSNEYVSRLNFMKPANSRLYFSKGVPLDYGRTNMILDKKTGRMIPGQGYVGPYIVEVKGVPMGSSTKGRAPGLEPTKIGSYAVSRRPISLDEVKFYKEDWLRGYKPINTPKQLPGSPNAASSVDNIGRGLALTQKLNIANDHMHGLLTAIGNPARYPLTSLRKAKLLKEQDDILKKAVNFVEEWNFNPDGTINNSVKQRMKDLTQNINTKNALDLYNRHDAGLFNPMKKPNKLVSTRRKDLKIADITDYDKDYITKNRGNLGGVNTKYNSITLRNIGNYYKKPQDIADIIVHESGHSTQELGKQYGYIRNKGSFVRTPSWGESTTKYNKKYGYYTANEETEAGKEFAKHMVKPSRYSKSQTWKSSPNELHSELMRARYNLVEKLSKNQPKEFRDAVIDRLRSNPTNADIDLLLKNGLNKFFKFFTSKADKRRLIRMLPAMLPATIGGAYGVNQMQDAQPMQKFGGNLKFQKGGIKKLSPYGELQMYPTESGAGVLGEVGLDYQLPFGNSAYLSNSFNVEPGYGSYFNPGFGIEQPIGGNRGSFFMGAEMFDGAPRLNAGLKYRFEDGGSLPTAGDPVLNFIQSQSPRFSKSKK